MRVLLNMDPLSMTVSITSLLLGCAKVTKAAQDLRLRYKGASLTMSSIATECSAVTTALSYLQNMIIGHSMTGQQDLVNTFDCVITGCTLTLSVLDEYVAELNYLDNPEAFNPSSVTRKDKMKVIWNEAEMRELLLQLQGHKSSIMLLLSIMQR